MMILFDSTGLFLQPVRTIVFLFQKIIIMIGFLKEMEECGGSCFFGHIQVVHDAG